VAANNPRDFPIELFDRLLSGACFFVLLAAKSPIGSTPGREPKREPCCGNKKGLDRETICIILGPMITATIICALFGVYSLGYYWWWYNSAMDSGTVQV
jgi:hypothetical protein